MNEITEELSPIEKVTAWMLLIVFFVFVMAGLSQAVKSYARYSCEHELQMMGLKGTIPPYYRQCYVEFPDGTMAPLDQLRWNVNGKSYLPEQP